MIAKPKTKKNTINLKAHQSMFELEPSPIDDFVEDADILEFACKSNGKDNYNLGFKGWDSFDRASKIYKQFAPLDTKLEEMVKSEMAIVGWSPNSISIYFETKSNKLIDYLYTFNKLESPLFSLISNKLIVGIKHFNNGEEKVKYYFPFEKEDFLRNLSLPVWKSLPIGFRNNWFGDITCVYLEYDEKKYDIHFGIFASPEGRTFFESDLKDVKIPQPLKNRITWIGIPLEQYKNNCIQDYSYYYV